MLFMDSTVTAGAYEKLVLAAVVVTRPANWTNSGGNAWAGRKSCIRNFAMRPKQNEDKETNTLKKKKKTLVTLSSAQ